MPTFWVKTPCVSITRLSVMTTFSTHHSLTL